MAAPDHIRPSVDHPHHQAAGEGGRQSLAEADALVAGTDALKTDRELLESIPGVGRQTATTIPAELPAVERLPSAESAAAYCGLASREFSSGTSVKWRTRLSKAGNARLRKALFLPTQTAVRFNPLLKGFSERLTDPERDGGPKPKMQALGACMRKLVICYGVLKNRTPSTPNGRHESPLDNTLSGSACLCLATARQLHGRVYTYSFRM